MECDYPTFYQRAEVTGEIWIPVILHKGDLVSKFTGIWEYTFWFGRRTDDGDGDSHKFHANLKRKTDGKKLRLEVNTCRLNNFDDDRHWDEKNETLPREWRLSVMVHILENAFGLVSVLENRMETKEIQPLT